MGFIESILSWIVGQVLSYLLGKAESQVTMWIDEMEKDKARGVTNDANVKAYEDAKDRATRTQAAVDLLNGTKP